MTKGFLSAPPMWTNENKAFLVMLYARGQKLSGIAADFDVSVARVQTVIKRFCIDWDAVIPRMTSRELSAIALRNYFKAKGDAAIARPRKQTKPAFTDKEFAAARCEHAFHLRYTEKLTFKNMGPRFGVSAPRARELLLKQERKMRRGFYDYGDDDYNAIEAAGKLE